MESIINILNDLVVYLVFYNFDEFKTFFYLINACI